MGSTPLKGTYSASRCAGVLELSPHQTRLHAFQNIMEENQPGWNQEHGYTLPEFQDSAPLRWGTAFESAIIKLAEEKEGYQIASREMLFTRDFGNIKLSCHVDGMFLRNGWKEDPLIHEGKTTWQRAFYSVKGEDCEIEMELDGETGIYNIIEFKRRWGEPGTDQVPTEYQIQCAVQRICTGAELVKLSVLVFPKSTQEFEELGWRVNNIDGAGWRISTEMPGKLDDPWCISWARIFAQIGNFHTYLLPTDKKLESLIIEAIQEFDEKYVKPELPPPATNYPDIRRLITMPMGTIVATEEMIAKANEAKFRIDSSFNNTL